MKPLTDMTGPELIRNWTRLNLCLSRTKKQRDTLQKMVNWQRDRIKQLEAEKSLAVMAEQHFKDTGNGTTQQAQNSQPSTRPPHNAA